MTDFESSFVLVLGCFVLVNITKFDKILPEEVIEVSLDQLTDLKPINRRSIFCTGKVSIDAEHNRLYDRSPTTDSGVLQLQLIDGDVSYGTFTLLGQCQFKPNRCNVSRRPFFCNKMFETFFQLPATLPLSNLHITTHEITTFKMYYILQQTKV